MKLILTVASSQSPQQVKTCQEAEYLRHWRGGTPEGWYLGSWANPPRLSCVRPEPRRFAHLIQRYRVGVERGFSELRSCRLGISVTEAERMERLTSREKTSCPRILDLAEIPPISEAFIQFHQFNSVAAAQCQFI